MTSTTTAGTTGGGQCGAVGAAVGITPGGLGGERGAAAPDLRGGDSPRRDRRRRARARGRLLRPASSSAQWSGGAATCSASTPHRRCSTSRAPASRKPTSASATSSSCRMRTMPSTSSRGSTPSSSPTTWSRNAPRGRARRDARWRGRDSGLGRARALRPSTRSSRSSGRCSPGTTRALHPSDLAEPGALEDCRAAGLTPTEAYGRRSLGLRVRRRRRPSRACSPPAASRRGRPTRGGDRRGAPRGSLAPFRAADGTYRLENEWHTLLATA